jgi:REP element-mobilizing transposase RayT
MSENTTTRSAKAHGTELEKGIRDSSHEVAYETDLDFEEAVQALNVERRRRRRRPENERSNQPMSRRLSEKAERRRRRAKRQNILQHGIFVHVTSRLHLQRRLLVEDRAKAILADLCHHYAKLCVIELHHYCIMDNHVHLVVRLRAGSRELGRMMADVKREFTKAYKEWFNGEYRRSIRYRAERLGKGTLWEGVYHAEVIKDTRQLIHACFYVEANRLKVIASQTIDRLLGSRISGSEVDDFNDQQASELIEIARNYGFQSARYYLDGCEGHDPVLTDGTDAQWASPDEVRKWWKVTVSKLPPGWRRVWYDGTRAILKPTPVGARRYPSSPLWHCLGKSSQTRSLNFRRLLVQACWRNREQLGVNPRETHAPNGRSIP